MGTRLPPTYPYRPTSAEVAALKHVDGIYTDKIRTLVMVRKATTDAPTQRSLWVSTKAQYSLAVKAAQKTYNCPQVVMASTKPNRID
jgi:hypothetical protein